MSYACLDQQEFDDGDYRLVPLRQQDIFLIKQWRNEQISILRQQVLLTDEKQKEYFEQTVKPSFSALKPNQILFSYLIHGQCIGYGGLVHIDWPLKQAEVSFLLNTERTGDLQQYRADFAAFLTLIKEIAFRRLSFERLYTETFDVRPHHVSILEEQGFILEKRLKQHVTVEGKPADSLIHGCLGSNQDLSHE